MLGSLLLALLLLVGVATPTLVNRLSPLIVRQGRMEYLHTGALQFVALEEGEQCKVEVVTNDPMTQRVGSLKPTVFDCHYPPYAIKYMHNGSPLLDEDQIKLRVYLFTNDATVTEVVLLPVQIQKAAHDIFVDNAQNGLQVEEFFGLSNVIDPSVLRFRYNYYNGASCVVSFSQAESQLPLRGNVVSGNGPNKKITNSLTHDCRDFLFMGLRYAHVSPPTPDTDYLPLTVEVNDPMQADEPVIEHLYLPIAIKGAFPNVPPRASFISSYIMEVDEFVPHMLDPEVMSAEDAETPSDNIVFNITKPLGPSEGYFVHLEDHSKPITSFLQGDLINHNIAYQPPNVSYTEKKILEVEFVAFDSLFAASDPIVLHIAISPSSSDAPRVTVNMGLTLIEGQARPITSRELQIVDRDNPEQLEVHVKGGLRHGTLLINGKPGMLFFLEDIEAGTVVYRHDDSDTATDRVILRITDGRNTIRTKFPINVLPKDDSAPYILNNMGLEVREGDYIQITTDLLSAHDKDSEDDEIVFLIRTPPKAGEIVQRFRPMTKGTLIPKFSLLELKRGYIYYHHLGGESMEDMFEFRLLDQNDPPNKSGKYIVDIRITAVDDMPPHKVSGTSMQMTVRETEVAHILKENLQFEDKETESEDLVYTITSQPYFLTTTITIDAGRIISTDGLLELTKDPDLLPVQTFTQSQINHHKIAYMPPIEDVGPIRRHAQFIFAVSDSKGNKVMDQIFDLTILPVNNQLPHISVAPVKVREGNGVTITTGQLTLYDPDTDQSDLLLTLEEPPAHGDLLLQEKKMSRGDRFTLHDIKLSNVRYVHDSSEGKEDSFIVTVSDGRNKVSKMVPIQVRLVDDLDPEFVGDLQTGLQVLEGEDVLITTDNLAVLDNDTDDLGLMFTIWKSPVFGEVQLEGYKTSEFSQQDLKQSKVRYVHTAGEVGPEPKEDTILFNVYDKGAPEEVASSLMELHFTIVPVDTEAPEVVLGGPLITEEGSKAVISLEVLSARDLDTLDETLTFIITRPPRWGFLENTKPLPGSEITRDGIPVTKFSMRDVMDETVNYVQANHSDLEPVRDRFEIYVTDGQKDSAAVWVDVNILPANDELPRLRLEDLVVEEGGEKMVNPVMIQATDMDDREDNLILSVHSPPRHGQLSLMMENHGHMQETPMHDVNMHDMRYKMHLKYKHDGSENYLDQFTLKLTDGKHTSKGTSKIKVMPVNDEMPRLVTNGGLTVKYGQMRALSSVVLHSVDNDNPGTELFYVLIEPPKQGMLERRAKRVFLTEHWEEVSLGGNFTQNDLDMNTVRYAHTGILGRGPTRDSFVFQVTDGVNSLNHETFKIDIVKTGETDLALLNKGLDVKEGEYQILNTNVLSATDNTDRPQDIMFMITTPPRSGRVELLADPGNPIDHFSQLDLAAQKVAYTHTAKQDLLSDSFSFKIVNSKNHSRSAVFYIRIESLDQALPSIVANMPLTVIQGEEAVMTTSNLQISDPDTSPANLTYTVVEKPRHGRLLKKGIPLEDAAFTQQDIDMGFVKYKSNRSDDSGNFDYFLFLVSDGHHKGYLLSNGTAVTKPAFFNILIQPLMEEPPRLVHNNPPSDLEFLGNDKYQYTLTDKCLKAVHVGSDNIDIVYGIVEQPQHGFLQHLGTNRLLRKYFSQKDVDDGNVGYVFEGSVLANNDSFTFRVQNGFGNSLRETRFYIQWSVIEMQEPQYIVCEDAGTITVPVIRSGNLNASSFVDIHTKEMSAKENIDFEPSPIGQLQFDPGSKVVNWELRVLADRLEEPNEKLKILLRHPVNAVIGQQHKSIVQLVSLKNGRCTQYINMISKDNRPSGPAKVPPFSSVKSKDSTLVNYHGITEADLDPPSKEDEDFDIFKVGLQYLAQKGGRGDATEGFNGNDEELEVDLSQLHPLEQYKREQDETKQRKNPRRPEGRRRKNNKKNRKGEKNRNRNRGDEDGLLLDDSLPGQTNNMPEGKPTIAPQSCTPDTKDLLYFDLASSNMYRCNGINWEKVGWGPNYLHTSMLRDASTGTFSSKEGTEDDAAAGEEKKEGAEDGAIVVDDIKLLQNRVGCPEDWEKHQNDCYKAMTSKQTWETAEETCKQMGGHLTDVQSETHLQWLWELVQEQPFWIGLNDIQEDGKWEFTTGHEVEYFNWKKRFPRKRNSQTKNCVLVAKRAEWVNRPCDEKRAKYVCSQSYRSRRKRGPARRHGGW